MEITQLPGEFQRLVSVQGESGCWFWVGNSTPSGHPVFRRKMAWKWAYLYATGRRDMPFDRYPTIPGCSGPLFCVFPDHRLNLPEDQAQVPHRCQCGGWHDPSVEQTPPPAAPPTKVAQHPEPRKFKLAAGGLEDLTPEQQAVEDMFEEFD